MKKNDFDKVEFERIKCPFCRDNQNLSQLLSAPDRLNNLPGEFFIVRCQRCGLVFQNPRPKEKYIELYYPDNVGYFIPSNIKMGRLKRKIDRLILANFFDYRNLGRKNFILKLLLSPLYLYFYRPRSVPKYVSGGKLLEIGCSHGVKLEYLKKAGWEVMGIEFNRKAAEYARKERGLNIFSGSFFDANLEENYFDAVVMDMVLEHLYYPQEAIKKIFKILKPGGQLVFSIPYFNGWEFGTFREFSYGLHLPAHLFFFSKNNIRDMLSDGFSGFRIIFQNFDRDVIASAFYKHREKGGFLLKIISRSKLLRWILIRPFVFILSLFGLTSRVTVKTKKA
ncbi:hypothetical protein A2108_00665 [Candidatus Wolfebacteria bacterium GWA1_42_9]|uniref:Methyltransferase type 11 domain-containing protein n=1 Tax=Candidatus Wolfebacteria bacterium GWA1_42_9 TaxID=1802553 RepID=A0A1F8DL00_9BACT|nr:MAG: hypothetical protein A2108_00665 [Candidatus Wolfebacteria bacterium GWA1_42_9]